MKKNIKYIISLTLAVAQASAFVACSDWTDTENLDLREPNINVSNSELYASYLANLREYRKSDHKIMMVGFDNTIKVPISYGHHLTAIPDSVDVVILTSPETLVERELNEMAQMREERATRFIYAISYPNMEEKYEIYKKAWNQSNPQPSENTESLKTFLEYITEQIDLQLSWADKFGYDGITVRYDGKSLLFMPEATKIEHLARQRAYMDAIVQWKATHESKMLLFEGNPQNLDDKTILQSCDYLVLRSETMTSSRELVFAITMMLQRGIPTDRFLVCSSNVSLDQSDVETGVFYDEDGVESVATIELAYWNMMESKNYARRGLIVYDALNDYYNSSLTYGHVRTAISIMNPSPKIN